jgi:hypothetical protein
VKRVIFVAALGVLALPSTAHGYSVHNYRVRDAGSTVRHSLTVCKDRYDLVHHFGLTSRVETADGRDRRFRYSEYTVRGGCRRLTQWYPDVLKYEGRYRGRVKVRLLQTDDVRYTPWRRFRSR